MHALKIIYTYNLQIGHVMLCTYVSTRLYYVVEQDPHSQSWTSAQERLSLEGQQSTNKQDDTGQLYCIHAYYVHIVTYCICTYLCMYVHTVPVRTYVYIYINQNVNDCGQNRPEKSL